MPLAPDSRFHIVTHIAKLAILIYEEYWAEVKYKAYINKAYLYRACKRLE